MTAEEEQPGGTPGDPGDSVSERLVRQLDQAKGILMAARRIPADEAFTLLVERSQHDNIKLRELARKFVAEVTETDQ